MYGFKAYLGYSPLTGKQVNIEKRGFTDKKAARAFYRQALDDFQNGRTAKDNNKNLTYGQVYTEWLARYKQTVKTSTGAKTEELFDLHIIPSLGSTRIRMIDSHTLQGLINKWFKMFEQYKKVFNYACKVLEYAMTQGYIDENPKKRVIIPRKKVTVSEDEGKLDYYTKDQLQALLGVLDGEWLVFFRLLAFTGLRRGEALALTWNDINFKDKTLRVNKTLTLGYNNELLIQTPKTPSGNRTISLDDRTLAILKAWRPKQAELLLGFGFNATRQGQLIFSKHSSNTPYDLAKPRSVLAKVCKNHNLPFIKVHGFRHTHCSLLFEAGVPIKDVKERLGHSDIQTTMNVYTHVTQDSRDKSAQLFAKYANF